MMDRSKLYEWLLDNKCPFDWDVDEKSSTDKTVNLIFSERTEHLKSAPLNRITHAQKIIADEELQEATRDLQDGYDDASRKISQVERKLDSLSSLKVLAGMVEENVRDAALTAITEGANSDGYLFDEYNEFEDKYK